MYRKKHFVNCKKKGKKKKGRQRKEMQTYFSLTSH
jgi:hypothetical protein